MVQPDSPNISDAILLALRKSGLIGSLKAKGAPEKKVEVAKAPPSRTVRRKQYPKPATLVLPPGVAWSMESGRPVVRVSINHRMRHVCTTTPTQAGADLAGRIVQCVRQWRDAGYDLDEIKQRARKVKDGQ